VRARRAPAGLPVAARRSVSAGRRAPFALALALLVAAALAAPARAGTFEVSQCAGWAYQADLWRVRGGWASVGCEAGGSGIRIGTPNYRLAHNTSVTTSFTVPDSMPATSLRTMWLDWRFTPQSPSGDPAYLTVWSGGARVLVSWPGGAGQSRRELPAGVRAIEADVWCSPAYGPGWCNWPGDLLELHGARFELEEAREPSAAASGALVADGDHAFVEPLEVTAADGDAGVRTVDVILAGVRVGSVRGECRDDRLPPCPQSLRRTLDIDTRAVPDGPVRLRLVVTDAAGNVRIVDAGTVTVRNQRGPVSPPPPNPTPPPDPPVHPAPPAGAARSPFPANPLAGRGHTANGTHANKSARLEAWLELPIRGRVLRRRAVTVPPGVRVRIRGRLRDPRGRPIGRATLAAIRREPGGPWTTITGVRTRPNGRFTAFTRIGPSQTVQFVYYAFGDSIAGRRSPRLRVHVR
jgi:hypothetical protein